MRSIIARMIIGASLCAALSGCAYQRPGQAESRLTFCCQAGNDLFRVLVDNGIHCSRSDSPADAVTKAPAGAGVLILADGYPDRTTTIEPAVLDAAAAKGLRLYIEYPGALPDVELGQPRGVRWERAVVASSFFAPTLNKMRILCIHGCRFTPAKAANPHLVLARVAGYDTAVFGLPKETFPVLFEHPRGNMLVATTKLSQFVTGRYGPTEAWRSVWQGILGWVNPQGPAAAFTWTPTVHPTYEREARLPRDVEKQALKRGIEWYRRGGQLVTASQDKLADELADQESRWEPLKLNTPVGDGAYGVLEGYCSTLDCLGRQLLRPVRRNDCTGESAGAFAFAGAANHNASDLTVAKNLNDYIYFNSPMAKGPRSDPTSPTYGLVGWMTSGPSLDVYYGDDNARSMLGTMASAALLKSTRWDEPLLRCLLANLRTTGRQGFRGNRLDEKILQAKGWKPFYDADLTNYAPHYECYIWACYLWAYHHTEYEPFLQRAGTAIRMTMEAYPGQWRWTNGIQQERARMLLPLAWLVRVEDTPEHRGWLKRVANDMVALQDNSGALREEIGDLRMGSLKPPQSNEQYGTNETSLLQGNGDPVSDLLYTTNFAFLGLHEAAAATKDPFYTEAEDKLTAFLCRIQVRSQAHPELDGAWYRAFDFRKWDYWASNGDSGWGGVVRRDRLDAGVDHLGAGDARDEDIAVGCDRRQQDQGALWQAAGANAYRALSRGLSSVRGITRSPLNHHQTRGTPDARWALDCVGVLLRWHRALGPSND